MPRDSIANTFRVAALLCVVCSVLVSAFAVGLRPFQQANRQAEIKKNILSVSGLLEDPNAVDARERDAIFAERVEAQVIDLDSGEVVEGVDPAEFDQIKMSKDPEHSNIIPSDVDIAGVKRREERSLVYFVNYTDGSRDQVVLPIRGYGLWSTLQGFLSLDSDLTTIRGLTYYEHKETPGLGGEVDNPSWKQLWNGKRAFEEDGSVGIHVIKGTVDKGRPEAVYEVDGLSGATITSRGVTNMLSYWLGEQGFGPFLDKLRAE